MKIKLTEFLSRFTDNKTLVLIKDAHDGKEYYKGRSEWLINDYGDNYPDAYHSWLSWIDNTEENVVLIFVEKGQPGD